MRCPNCGGHDVRKREFSNGAVERDCPECHWWDYEPPPPTVQEIRERHREQWDGDTVMP